MTKFILQKINTFSPCQSHRYGTIIMCPIFPLSSYDLFATLQRYLQMDTASIQGNSRRIHGSVRLRDDFSGHSLITFYLTRYDGYAADEQREPYRTVINFKTGTTQYLYRGTALQILSLSPAGPNKSRLWVLEVVDSVRRLLWMEKYGMLANAAKTNNIIKPLLAKRSCVLFFVFFVQWRLYMHFFCSS